jgi:hypothetical protein
MPCPAIGGTDKTTGEVQKLPLLQCILSRRGEKNDE